MSTLSKQACPAKQVYTFKFSSIKVSYRAFQRFSSNKLVLKAVESCFVALEDYENGSTTAVLPRGRHSTSERGSTLSKQASSKAGVDF